ncbi:MAG: hypothetical protein LBC93_06520, partial [Synergistaceae bacterium]|nr:hypothetical protein [Synergistaceae bacterium]
MRRIFKVRTMDQLGWYQVELQPNGSLEYNNIFEEKKYFTSSESAWERFERSCERIGVRKWESVYTSETEDCDGGFWWIEIDFDGLQYKG